MASTDDLGNNPPPMVALGLNGTGDLCLVIELAPLVAAQPCLIDAQIFHYEPGLLGQKSRLQRRDVVSLLIPQAHNHRRELLRLGDMWPGRRPRSVKATLLTADRAYQKVESSKQSRA